MPVNPKKIAKETTISLAGMTFGNGLRYLFVGLLTRFVGVEFVGIYSLANAITRFIEVIGKAGLDRGILRFVSMQSVSARSDEIHRDISSAIKMAIVFSFLIMLIQIMLAGWLAFVLFNGGSLLKYVLLANAIALPFSILTLILASASQGFKLLKYKVLITNIIGPATMVLTVLAARIFESANIIIMLPLLVSSIVSALTAIHLMQRLSHISIRSVVQSKFNKELLRFSYPLMFVTIIGTLMHWMDVIMLGYFTDSTTVGLYYPAARTAGLMRSILLAFMSIFAPMLSEMYSNGRTNEMSKLYKLITRWIITLAVPLALVLFMFPGKIMLLFGSEYLASTSILVILSLAAVIQVVVGAGGPTLTMTGHPKINLLNSTVLLIVNASLNITLIPRIGASGAAWATCVSMVVLGMLRSIEVWHFVRLQPLSWKLIKPLIAGMAVFLVLALLKSVVMPLHTIASLIIIGASILIVYLLALWGLRPDQDDRQVWEGIMMLKIKGKRIRNG